MYPFYYIATFLTKFLLTLLTRCRVTGLEQAPRKGAVILVSNHISNVDPPILAAVLPRRVVFMAKEELYYGRNLFGFLTRGFGAFPVRRGEVDRKALKLALMALERGNVLGVFPEGTRSPNAQMQEAQLGAAWIALESGASVLPVGIWGTEVVRSVGDVLGRPSVRVNVGKPFKLPPMPAGKRSAQLGEATRVIMQSIAVLLPPEYRGVYGSVEAAV